MIASRGRSLLKVWKTKAVVMGCSGLGSGSLVREGALRSTGFTRLAIYCAAAAMLPTMLAPARAAAASCGELVI